MPPPIRTITGLRFAHRGGAHELPEPSSAAAKLGLQFERRVHRELLHYQAAGALREVQHNPWFAFEDKNGVGTCCPDFLIRTAEGWTIIEVKLTWVAEAERKLQALYAPVVTKALFQVPTTLVVCRRLASAAPPADVALGTVLAKRSGLLLWPSNGRIPW